MRYPSKRTLRRDGHEQRNPMGRLLSRMGNIHGPEEEKCLLSALSASCEPSISPNPCPTLNTAHPRLAARERFPPLLPARHVAFGSGLGETDPVCGELGGNGCRVLPLA